MSEVNKKIKEIKEQIKVNSKDAHFADTLLEELHNLYLRKKNPVVALDCGTIIEGKGFKGDTFEITLTNKGILYHTYGGYNLFVEPQNTALYETLFHYINEKDFINNLSGEEKENFELFTQALAYVLNCPLFATAEDGMLFDVANVIIENLTKMLNKSFETELQEETVEEDRVFKDATMAIEDLKEEVKKL